MGAFLSGRQAIQPRLEKAGFWGDVEITDPRTGEIRTTRFNQARLDLIFDVNTRQSYAAGRWQQLQAAPYWQYDHQDWVEHPRPQGALR